MLVTFMSACSGRNYDFRCINVVFQRVLRESARTAAKRRTNLSTNSGKATKWLDRLARNLAHMGVSGGQTIKSLGSCQTAGAIGTNFGSRLRIHLGMDIGKYNSPINTSGAFGGGVRVHIFKVLGKLSND